MNYPHGLLLEIHVAAFTVTTVPGESGSADRDRDWQSANVPLQVLSLLTHQTFEIKNLDSISTDGRQRLGLRACIRF